MRVALTIAGSDSGGGAGIQADLKTFQRFGVFGTSAITAITAQNTRGVRSWEALSPILIRDNALVNYVLDPVMISTSGDRLLDDDAVAVIRRDLIPLATLITPNSEEAAALTGEAVKSASDAARAAERLVRDYGAVAALVK